MKNKFKYLIGILVLSLIFSMTAYAFQGIRSVSFRVSLLLIFFVLAVNVFYFRKYVMASLQRGKSAKIKLLEMAAIIFFGIALLGLMKSFDLNFDLTSRKLLSLSSETKNIVKNISKPLTIYIFSYRDGQEGIMDYPRKLALRYEALNPKFINIKEIDPVQEKRIADDFAIQENGTLVFEMDGQREYILPRMLVETYEDDTLYYKGETVFSAVIDKLSKNKATAVYLLTGNGELDWSSSGTVGYDGIISMLKDRRYKVESLNLDHYPAVPDDASVLIIGDPRTQLSEATYHSIMNYIERGGSLMYFLSAKTVELNYLLMKAGIFYLPNVAIDPSRTAKNAGTFSLIPVLSPKSAITKPLIQKKLSVTFPSSAAICVVPKDYMDTNYIYDLSPLAKTTPNAFGERDFRSGSYIKDTNDIIGPFDVAFASIVAPKNDPVKQNRYIIFGSTDFIDNSRRFSGGNTQLFLNSIDFLLNKDLKMSVPPKIEQLSFSIPEPQEERIMTILTIMWISIWILVAILLLVIRANKVKKISEK